MNTFNDGASKEIYSREVDNVHENPLDDPTLVRSLSDRGTNGGTRPGTSYIRNQPTVMKPLYNNSLPTSLDRRDDANVEAYGAKRPNVKVSILETNNDYESPA